MPLCGAAKSAFAPEAAAKSAAPAPTVAPPALAHDDMQKLSPGALSILCSNLARGCEKQYKEEEAALFREIADWFAAAAPAAQETGVDALASRIGEDLAAYPALNAAAVQAGDRGTQRICVWGEKVTAILKTMLERYRREGEGHAARYGTSGSAPSAVLPTSARNRPGSVRSAKSRRGNSRRSKGGLPHEARGGAQPAPVYQGLPLPLRLPHRGYGHGEQRHRHGQMPGLRRLRRGLPQRSHLHGARGLSAPAEKGGKRRRSGQCPRRTQGGEEKIALQTAETAAEDGLYRLCKAVAKSVHLVGEDILREAGYMLPQSGNAHNLLASWAVSPPAEGFPLDAVCETDGSRPLQ